jgi:hypothetical protein
VRVRLRYGCGRSFVQRAFRNINVEHMLRGRAGSGVRTALTQVTAVAGRRSRERSPPSGLAAASDAAETAAEPGGEHQQQHQPEMRGAMDEAVIGCWFQTVRAQRLATGTRSTVIDAATPTPISYSATLDTPYWSLTCQKKLSTPVKPLSGK